MNYKKVCGTFLTLAMLSSSVLSASAFADVSGWAENSVNQAIAMGIVPENLQNTQAKKAISRAEFCEVVVKLYENQSGQSAPKNVVSPFTDTDNKVIAAASSLGLVNGKGNGIFDPYSTITRQEFCVMLCNVTRAVNGSSDIVDTDLISDFPDGNKVASWAKQDMETIVNHGIMTGMIESDGKTKLNPLETTSREQAMVMAVRYSDTYNNNSFNDGEQPEVTPEESNEPEQDNSQDIILTDNPILPEEAASLSKEERLMRVFGKTEIGYDSQQQAESAMTEITVPVWRLQEDGSKKAGKMTLTVNKNLSLVYQAIFEEIFNGEEQFPIKDGGSYAWRSNKRSEHRWGSAIDLNWNENMECNIDEQGNVTQITSGSHWLPNEDPYSIPSDGDVVKAFAKYGFAWGGNAWKSKRDYMHFSYFGT